MKKLFSICLLLLGIQFTSKAQIALETDTLRNFPYICQADSFTVTVSGMQWNGGYVLDSVRHNYRNDSLLIYIYYKWTLGVAMLWPFQLPLRFVSPQPALYTIYSKRFTNGMPHAHGTSHIGICTAISGIKRNPLLQEIILYPNPTENILNIGLPENSKDIAVQLSDLTGKVILNRNFKASEQKQLNLENLQPGIYLLTLQTEKGKMVQKIVKN